jgi:hypothetical protein
MILSLETVQTHTLVVKVELHHGIVTNMVTAMGHPLQVTLMVTCIIYGVIGLKVFRPSHPTQDTTTTLTNSDSDGLKLMLTQHQTADITHTTTGVTTTHPIMVDKGHSSLLKDTLEDHTTSVSIMRIHIT